MCSVSGVVGVGLFCFSHYLLNFWWRRHSQAVATDWKALESVAAIRVSLQASGISSVRVCYGYLGLGNGSALLIRYCATHRTGIGLSEYRRHQTQCQHQPSHSQHTAQACAKSIHAIPLKKTRLEKQALIPIAL